MLSVLAFKRSLSAGILDGGSGEIVLGGSRLSRFMKDVENVTGRMGEGEAMAPAEEAINVAAAVEEPLAEAAPLLLGVAAAASGPSAADSQNQAPLDGSQDQASLVDAQNPAPLADSQDQAPLADAQNQAPLADSQNQAPLAGGQDGPQSSAAQDGPPPAQPDPWPGLLQFGADLLSALTSPDAGTAPAHPWVERDPASGARHLKVPMPSPQTASRLADALTAISEALRR